VCELALAQALPRLISRYRNSILIYPNNLKGKNSRYEPLPSFTRNKPGSRMLHLNFGGKFETNRNFF
jgi:hypothetical protein